jgi:uncharacterized membrane protein
VSIEDVLGGRVLAWLGGLAVLVGLVFFFAVAISRGWVGPEGRVSIAAAVSLGLLVLGVWLREQKGRAEAAVAAAATGIGGLFITVTVATEVYELIPFSAGLVAALFVGGGGTALALRWRSQVVAAFGIVGALLAPVLAAAPSTGATIALLFVAAASATAVLAWQRWDWLAFAVPAIVVPQWTYWLFTDATVAGALVVLVGFGSLGIAAAIGFDFRIAAQRVRVSSCIQLASNALVLALVGYLAFEHLDHETVGKVWTAALAVAHLGVGVAAPRLPRVSAELRRLAFVLGVGLADVALILMLDDVALAASWAAAGVLFALIARRTTDPMWLLGAPLHLGFALMHVLAIEAPASALVEGADDMAEAAGALAALVVACLACARLAGSDVRWRAAFAGSGAIVLLYLASVGIITAFQPDPVPQAAPVQPAPAPVQPPPYQPGAPQPYTPPPGPAPAPEAKVLDLDVRQQGQVLLSALWSIVGLVALVVGLRHDLKVLRLGALGLLLVTVGKVFLYDLAALESEYRVISFIGLGLLLLAGAFAYQRMRPRAADGGPPLPSAAR